MIQRGKDILGQGARSVTPHMTQPLVLNVCYWHKADVPLV